MNIHKTLKERNWVFDEDETSCIAYVKGIYDLWYFPKKKYLEIESEEHGYHYKGYVQSEKELIQALP